MYTVGTRRFDRLQQDEGVDFTGTQGNIIHANAQSSSSSVRRVISYGLIAGRMSIYRETSEAWWLGAGPSAAPTLAWHSPQRSYVNKGWPRSVDYYLNGIARRRSAAS